MKKYFLSSLIVLISTFAHSEYLVEMYDNLNDFNSELKVYKGEKKHQYFIEESAMDYEAEEIVYKEEERLITVGPYVLQGKDHKLRDLERNYDLSDDAQLSFTIKTPKVCDDFEMTMIYLFVLNWFYFG